MLRNCLAIEDIEALRRREGILDDELRKSIGKLKVDDIVRLTFLTGTKGFGGETLRVRITSIRGHAFRGKLVNRLTSPGLAQVQPGTQLVFTAGHIHSVAKKHLAGAE